MSILAQKLGEFCGHSGGGHKNASGCKIYNRDRFKENLLELFYESMDALKLGNFLIEGEGDEKSPPFLLKISIQKIKIRV